MRLALIATAAVIACRSAHASGQPGGGLASMPVTRLRPNEESFSAFSGLSDSARVVIRDSAAWRQVWQAINRPFIPPPPEPRVDFRREMIVVAALGRRPSEGYGVVIEDAVRDSGTIEIGVRRTIPGSGCPTSAVITQPVDIARLPADDAPVRFRERNVVVPCGVR